MKKTEAVTDANLICSVGQARDTLECLASADHPLFAHEAAKRRHTSIATRKPHDCTAMGRAIWVFLLGKERITILDQTKLERRTEMIIANGTDQRSQRLTAEPYVVPTARATCGISDTASSRHTFCFGE
jgi:DNA-binding IclR family transcriptional regulator